MRAENVIKFEEVDRLFEYNEEEGNIYWKKEDHIHVKMKGKIAGNLNEVSKSLVATYKGKVYTLVYVAWSLFHKEDISLLNTKLRVIGQNKKNLKIDNIKKIIYPYYSIVRILDFEMMWWNGSEWDTNKEARIITKTFSNAEKIRYQLTSYKRGRYFLIKEFEK